MIRSPNDATNSVMYPTAIPAIITEINVSIIQLYYEIPEYLTSPGVSE